MSGSWSPSRCRLAFAGRAAKLSGVVHIAHDVRNGAIEASQLPANLDGLVYCPGSISLGTLRSVSADVLRSDFELNVVGAMQCVQSALPMLRNSTAASLVFFSTVAVAQGLAMHTVVAAVKGAVEALVRTWAVELAPKIRVNCIAPALTDTPLAERFLNSEEKTSVNGCEVSASTSWNG